MLGVCMEPLLCVTVTVVISDFFVCPMQCTALDRI